MIVFFLGAVLVLLLFCRLSPRLSFDEDYFSKSHTQSLSGFFVLLVFLSHAVTYTEPAGWLDSAYLFIKEQLSQLVVAPFFFFSGYGILTAVKTRGKAYLKSFPLHRIGKLLLRAEAVVLLFLLTDFCLGFRYPLRRVLLSLLFWESIGNSNWYLFVVFALYLFAFLSFFPFAKRLWCGAALVTALSLALVFVLRFAGKDSWWYNTLLLFPAGVWFALAKPRIDCFLKSTPRFLCASAVFGALFVLFRAIRGHGLLFYELWALSFMACIVLVMTRVRFDNALLRFFGRHTFAVYLLQRIPMLVFTCFGLEQSRYLFVALCFAATLALAVAFDQVFSKLLSNPAPSPRIKI